MSSIMHWPDSAERVNATPILQTIMQAVPPHYNREHVEQYERLTAPAVEQSTIWWQQFWDAQNELWANWMAIFQQWQQATPLPEIGNAIEDATETTLRSFDGTVAKLSIAEAEVTEFLTSWTSEAEDDLTAIAGIGPALARRLNDAGVNSYADIASWSEADIQQIERSVLGGRFAGRIQRDDWIAQAQTLSARG